MKYLLKLKPLFVVAVLFIGLVQLNGKTRAVSSEDESLVAIQATGEVIHWETYPEIHYTRLVDSHHQSAFCIEPDLKLPHGELYSSEKLENPQVVRILQASMFNTEGFWALQPDSDQREITTWVALNIILGTKPHWASFVHQGNDYLDALMRHAETGRLHEQMLTIVSSAQEGDSGSVYDQSRQQLVSKAVFAAEGTQTTFQLAGLATGVYPVNEQGEPITGALSTAQPFRLATANLSLNEEVHFTLKANSVYVQLKAPQETLQAVVGVSQLKEQLIIQPASVQFNPAPSRLVLGKQDKQGIWYPGVTFEYGYTPGQVLGTLQTDQRGKAELDGLHSDVIYVRESQVVAPLIINREWIRIELKAGQESTYIAKNNRGLGKLTGQKFSESKEPLADAVFALYAKQQVSEVEKHLDLDEMGQLVDVGWLRSNAVALATSDADGNYGFSGLALGNYFIVELQSPSGYQLNPSIEFIALTYSNQDTPVVHKQLADRVNKRRTIKVSFKKVDQETREILSSPELIIVIYNEAMEEIARVSPNTENSYAMAELTAGVWYYQEIKAPEGYQLDTQVYRFELTGEEEKGAYWIEVGNTKQPDPEVILPNTAVLDQSYNAILLMGCGSAMIVLPWVLFREKEQ